MNTASDKKIPYQILYIIVHFDKREFSRDRHHVFSLYDKIVTQYFETLTVSVFNNGKKTTVPVV